MAATSAPATALARSSCSPKAWSMLSRPLRETRRSSARSCRGPGAGRRGVRAARWSPTAGTRGRCRSWSGPISAAARAGSASYCSRMNSRSIEPGQVLAAVASRSGPSRLGSRDPLGQRRSPPPRIRIAANERNPRSRDGRTRRNARLPGSDLEAAAAGDPSSESGRRRLNVERCGRPHPDLGGPGRRRTISERSPYPTTRTCPATTSRRS